MGNQFEGSFGEGREAAVCRPGGCSNTGGAQGPVCRDGSPLHHTHPSERALERSGTRRANAPSDPRLLLSPTAPSTRNFSDHQLLTSVKSLTVCRFPQQVVRAVFSAEQLSPSPVNSITLKAAFREPGETEPRPVAPGRTTDLSLTRAGNRRPRTGTCRLSPAPGSPPRSSAALPRLPAPRALPPPRGAQPRAGRIRGTAAPPPPPAGAGRCVCGRGGISLLPPTSSYSR